MVTLSTGVTVWAVVLETGDEFYPMAEVICIFGNQEEASEYKEWLEQSGPVDSLAYAVQEYDILRIGGRDEQQPV